MTILSRHLLVALSCAILAAGALPSASAQIQINTTGNVDSAFGYLGENNVPVLGQSFVAPGVGSTKLDAFEFIVQKGNANPFAFHINVMQWNPIAQVGIGPVLYTSGVYYYDRNRGAERFRIPTNALQLNSGTNYLAFISSIGNGDGVTDGEYFAQIATTNPYSGGSMYYKDTNTNTANLTSGAWTSYTAGGQSAPSDMALRLMFDQPYFANIALGAAVTLSGAFNSAPALASTLTDGVFLPAGSAYNVNTVQWSDVNSYAQIDLGQTYVINGLNFQGDDNDSYLIEYRASPDAPWTLGWTGYNLGDGPNGMQSRADPSNNARQYFTPAPIYATQLRVRADATSGDGLYALSEIQAFGAPLPEPGAVTLFVSGGIVGLGVLLRRRSQIREHL